MSKTVFGTEGKSLNRNYHWKDRQKIGDVLISLKMYDGSSWSTLAQLQPLHNFCKINNSRDCRYHGDCLEDSLSDIHFSQRPISHSHINISQILSDHSLTDFAMTTQHDSLHLYSQLCLGLRAVAFRAWRPLEDSLFIATRAASAVACICIILWRSFVSCTETVTHTHIN